MGRSVSKRYLLAQTRVQGHSSRRMAASERLTFTLPLSLSLSGYLTLDASPAPSVTVSSFCLFVLLTPPVSSRPASKCLHENLMYLKNGVETPFAPCVRGRHAEPCWIIWFVCALLRVPSFNQRNLPDARFFCDSNHPRISRENHFHPSIWMWFEGWYR